MSEEQEQEQVDDPENDADRPLTMKELGLLEHADKKHKLLEMFVQAKSQQAVGAVNPATTVSNQKGYLSRMIGFIEQRIPPASRRDHFDMLRHPDLHKEFISKLNLSMLEPPSKDNFKKAIDLLVYWCSAGSGLKGGGRLRLHGEFWNPGHYLRSFYFLSNTYQCFRLQNHFQLQGQMSSSS